MDAITLHASCVAVQGRGVLIMGGSGSGKSSLALELMAYGADLVADDRTVLTTGDRVVVAKAPESIANMIEARGIGILNAQAVPQADIVCVVDLDQPEPERLPEHRFTDVLGRKIPLIFKADTKAFAASLLQYLKGGRQDTE